MINRLTRVLLLLGLFAGCMVHAQAVQKTEFARGMSLETTTANAVYRLSIPVSVYKSTRADLADLRVYNANNQAVPHAIIRQTPQQTRISSTLPHYLFESSSPQTDNLRLTLNQTADTTQLNIQTSPLPATSAPKFLLIDASNTSAPLTELLFEWGDAQEFMVRVTLDSSDDLLSWRPVTAGVLARLQQQGFLLEQNRLRFAATSAKYYRLRLDSSEQTAQALPVITHVSTVQFTESSVGDSVRVQPGLLATTERDGMTTFVYDQQARLPVRSIRVQLAERNTFMNATLTASDLPDGPYQPWFNGSLYDLTYDNERLQSPDISLPDVRSRYWQLGSQTTTQAPQLEFMVVPDTLVFIAQGEGPFSLAFGHASAPDVSVASHEVLAVLPSGVSLDTLPLAISGEISDLAGDAALQAPKDPQYLQYALWTLLLAAVGVLAWMALSLLKRLPEQS